MERVSLTWQTLEKSKNFLLAPVFSNLLVANPCDARTTIENNI
jgi:hypothetical protein